MQEEVAGATLSAPLVDVIPVPGPNHMTEQQWPEPLFYLRRAIARIGEADWMAWWDSNALNIAGDRLMPRIFKRTAPVTAVHVAVEAARARQDPVLPREPRMHLFDLGRDVEDAFERWLTARKQEGWAPDPLPDTSDGPDDVAAALELLAVAPASEVPGADTDFVLLGETARPGADAADEILDAARRLAGAYTASARGRLVVPYFRVAA